MKKEFSTKWKGSKQPRKKIKYVAKAPLHIKKKFLRVALSKEIRKKYGRRNVLVRKGDKVKIMNGRFKKKEGKVTRVFSKIGKITVEGIQRKKRDGSKVDVKIYPSNTMIVELDLSNGNREKIIKKEINIKQNKEGKVEDNK